MEHRDLHEIIHDLLRYRQKLNEGPVDLTELHIGLSKCVEALLYVLDGQMLIPGFVTEERIDLAKNLNDHA